MVALYIFDCFERNKGILPDVLISLLYLSSGKGKFVCRTYAVSKMSGNKIWVANVLIHLSEFYDSRVAYVLGANFAYNTVIIKTSEISV